jgi:hypothetical protein
MFTILPFVILIVAIPTLIILAISFLIISFLHYIMLVPTLSFAIPPAFISTISDSINLISIPTITTGITHVTTGILFAKVSWSNVAEVTNAGATPGNIHNITKQKIMLPCQCVQYKVPVPEFDPVY